MRECFALSQRVPRGEVDMVALFPDGRDFTDVFANHAIPEHTPEEIDRCEGVEMKVTRAKCAGACYGVQRARQHGA